MSRKNEPDDSAPRIEISLDTNVAEHYTRVNGGAILAKTPARSTLTAALLLAFAVTASAQWVEDSIDVGGAWVGDLVYNSREDVVYGRCQTAGIFFAIACSTNELVAQWPLSRPQQMAYDSIDNKAYVAFYNGNEDSVAVIDGATHQRIRAIPLASATTPVWDPANNCVYVSCLEEDRVSVIDCATDSVVCYIPVGNGPLKMHLNSRHHKLYVQNHDAKSISVIDLETSAVVNSVRLDYHPLSGCYSESLDRYYCGAGDLVVIDGASDSALARVPIPGGPSTVAVNEEAGLVIVGADSIHVLVPSCDSIVAVFGTGSSPQASFWSPASRFTYCASAGPPGLEVLSPDCRRVETTPPMSACPFVLSYSPARARLYVGHLNSRWVYVVKDSATGMRAGRTQWFFTAARLHASPTPFRGEVQVECRGMSPPPERVSVYSRSGRLVRQLCPVWADAATSRFHWDGKDAGGAAAPSGVFVLVADSEYRTIRSKVVKAR